MISIWLEGVQRQEKIHCLFRRAGADAIFDWPVRGQEQHPQMSPKVQFYTTRSGLDCMFMAPPAHITLRCDLSLTPHTRQTSHTGIWDSFFCISISQSFERRKKKPKLTYFCPCDINFDVQIDLLWQYYLDLNVDVQIYRIWQLFKLHVDVQLFYPTNNRGHLAAIASWQSFQAATARSSLLMNYMLRT